MTMIAIKSIRNVRYKEFDEVWAIVRSMKNPSKYIKHVPDISPSLNLFFKAKRLMKENKWNKQTFNEIYVPQFLQEMNTQLAYDTLNKIYQIDKTNGKLCLVCFCPDETMCHRSIIAGILQGVGCDVHTEINADYRKYYELHHRIMLDKFGKN